MGNSKTEKFDWSPPRVVKLRKWWGTMTARDIAAKLGTSRNSVISKANRLGLEMGSERVDVLRDVGRDAQRGQAFDWSEARIDILRAGYGPAATQSVTEICAAIGCGRSTMHRMAHKLGLVHPHRAFSGRPGFVPKAARPPESLAQRRAKQTVPVAPESRNLALIDLDVGCCRFPTSPNDAPHGAHRFCGAKIALDPGENGQGGVPMHLPYCAFHQRVAVREGFTFGIPVSGPAKVAA